jgi:hypothetical protein
VTDPIDFSERAERARRGMPLASHEGDGREGELRSLSSWNPVFDGVEAGDWRVERAREDGLPEGCPVVPLGWDGDGFWFLSGRGHLFALGENAGKGNVDALFTPYSNFPVWAWPRKQKSGDKYVVKGNFEAEEARKDLFRACAHAGPYDPMKTVRGRGAWRDRHGGLVLHLGTHLIVDQALMRAGVVHDGRAYPVGPALPPPAHDAFGPGEDLPGKEILSHLMTWNWQRGEVDARLELGWMACAMVAGALDWRPYVFATGDAGAGKSTLVKYVMHVLGGEDAVLKPEDATEAGVAQTLGVDSVPVLLDEAENEADDKRAEKLIRLARRAASGNQRLRGGADGKSTLSVIRSCFHFAAINAPTMGDQDLSRMALLAMRPIPKTRRRVKPWSLGEIEALGRAMHRQVIDWFAPRSDGVAGFDHVLAAFREGLIENAAHDERGADTFGYLLAGYWCAVEIRDPDPEEILELVTPLHRDTLAELENIKPGWKKILDFMLDARPKALERSTWKSVRAILLALRDGSAVDADGYATTEETARPRPEKVNQELAKVGLKLKWKRGVARSFENAVLFVPNSNPSLAELFEKTRWSVSDPSDAGNWQYALRGGPDDIIAAGKASGREPRGTLIKIAEVMGKAPSRDEEE